MDLRCFSLVWLVLFCSALPAESQPPDVKLRYIKFLNQHVYDQMNEHICTETISKRSISEGNTNNCKQVNTFIKASTKNIIAVCGNAGKPKGGDLYGSTVVFSVVTCKRKSGERHPKCEYRGTKDTRYITVACDQGWPVHYEEGTIAG